MSSPLDQTMDDDAITQSQRDEKGSDIQQMKRECENCAKVEAASRELENKALQDQAELRAQRTRIAKLEQELLKAKKNETEEKGTQEEVEHNWWNVSACHGDLEIVGPKRLSVHFKGNGKEGFRAVLAMYPITRSNDGIFYFEIHVKNKKGGVAIGIGPDEMGLDVRVVGLYADAYGYASSGGCWINAVMKEQIMEFSVGDVVGCGVILAKRRIFFTKNGDRLDLPAAFDLTITSYFNLNSLFPFVTMNTSGDKIEANFGPSFKFDIANL